LKVGSTGTRAFATTERGTIYDDPVGRSDRRPAGDRDQAAIAYSTVRLSRSSSSWPNAAQQVELFPLPVGE
jgi:hypothetical protein